MIMENDEEAVRNSILRILDVLEMIAIQMNDIRDRIKVLEEKVDKK
jgi:hypothetical protein